MRLDPFGQMDLHICWHGVGEGGHWWEAVDASRDVRASQLCDPRQSQISSSFTMNAQCTSKWIRGNCVQMQAAVLPLIGVSQAASDKIHTGMWVYALRFLTCQSSHPPWSLRLSSEAADDFLSGIVFSCTPACEYMCRIWKERNNRCVFSLLENLPLV